MSAISAAILKCFSPGAIDFAGGGDFIILSHARGKECTEFKHRLNLRIVCIRLDDKRWRAQVVIICIRYRQRQFKFNFLMKVSRLKIRFLFLLIQPWIGTYKLCSKVFVLCWNCLITEPWVYMWSIVLKLRNYWQPPSSSCHLKIYIKEKFFALKRYFDNDLNK